MPVIMLTAKTMRPTGCVGLTAGADDYIVKPFDTLELVARVRSTLRRNAEMRARVAADRAAGQLPHRGGDRPPARQRRRLRGLPRRPRQLQGLQRRATDSCAATTSSMLLAGVAAARRRSRRRAGAVHRPRRRRRLRAGLPTRSRSSDCLRAHRRATSTHRSSRCTTPTTSSAAATSTVVDRQGSVRALPARLGVDRHRQRPSGGTTATTARSSPSPPR